jgi:hypothetical protein
MFSGLIMSRAWKYIGGSLLVTLLLVSAFAGLQTKRLGNRDATIAANSLTIQLQDIRIRTDSDTLKDRDRVIGIQNKGIAALSAERVAEREGYLKVIAAADERAKDDDKRAAEILTITLDDPSELAQCRAARSLLIEELQ